MRFPFAFAILDAMGSEYNWPNLPNASIKTKELKGSRKNALWINERVSSASPLSESSNLRALLNLGSALSYRSAKISIAVGPFTSGGAGFATNGLGILDIGFIIYYLNIPRETRDIKALNRRYLS